MMVSRSLGDAAMGRLMLVMVLGLAVLGQAHAQESRGSANYMLQFCQTWLTVGAKWD
jgi:hypothetical protein